MRSTPITSSSKSFQAFSNNIQFGTSGRNSALGSAPQSPPPQNSANESGSGEFVDQEQDETDFYDSEDPSSVIVRDYPEYPDPVNLIINKAYQLLTFDVRS